MKSFGLVFVVALSSLVLLFSCGSPDLEQNSRSQTVLVVSGANCFTLYAGQTIDAGQVCVAVVGSNLEVTYTTRNGWTLQETHVWVGSDLSTMPQTSAGNPKIGNFPYKNDAHGGSTTTTYKIPLSAFGSLEELCNSQLFVAAHASVTKDDGSGGVQQETGWSDGERFVKRGSWATYSTVKFECKDKEEPGPDPTDCETAYAKGKTTFVDLGLTRKRWGWQLGPIPANATMTTDLYAGAGQNDTSKGTLVGQVKVEYDGSTAKVTYLMNDGAVMKESHVYVGTTNVSTIAPGKLGNTHELDNATSDSFKVSGFQGEDIYVVAHAVVCQ